MLATEAMAETIPARTTTPRRMALVPCSVAASYEPPRCHVDDLPLPEAARERLGDRGVEHWRQIVTHVVALGHARLLVAAAERYGVASDQFVELVLSLATWRRCRWCGQAFPVAFGDLYCSDKCRRIAATTHPGERAERCPCGEPLPSSRWRYCCEECADRGETAKGAERRRQRVLLAHAAAPAKRQAHVAKRQAHVAKRQAHVAKYAARKQEGASDGQPD